MKRNRNGTNSGYCRHGRLVVLGAMAIGVMALAGCGAGDGSSSSGSAANLKQTASQQSSPPTGNQPYVDPVAYSMGATDGLAASQVTEKSATMQHQWTSGKTTVNYTTTAGHLSATDANGNPEASMSYFAYTAPSTNGAPRPVTFIYSGGPGSSAIWLHLGSFAPTRVATPDPLFGNWPNYPRVDNAESLIATTDLVYIDPPGTGLSEAVLPNTNKTFWTFDSDVNVMRDFIERYIAVNQRSASPLYLYGESYGTARTDTLALALESAGVHLKGIVLQSSILNLFADATDAAIEDFPTGLALATDTLAGYLPSYAEVAAYYDQASPTPIDQGLYALQVELFVTAQYRTLQNYSQSWTLSQIGAPNALGTPVFPSTQTLQSWELPSSLTMQALQGYFNATPYSTSLIPGSKIGRYDGRVSLPVSDPRLQTDADPSDILVETPFANSLATQMPDYFGYTAPNAAYVPFNSNIIFSWDYSHAGQALADTIPDLLGALTLNPQLAVYSENGFYDLAAPFFNTEKQLARLQTVPGLNPNLQVSFFQGGHMTYLDDTGRPQMAADLTRFYNGRPIPGALTLWTLPRAWRDEAAASTPTGSTPVTQTAAP
ncbi:MULTISPECIES: peptidase S10 [Paraburkholderia]|uniref:S10 family serine carboxypeptidase-like protein n=1 Tax=Paraburkholderia TaxID=1822464 RepID=UPI002250F676|nr:MULTISPECIES: peptidase S10 [Paraburkholderia]MCX4165993.1 peptidase S10 [Paraburkholderia megapolitana]MDN7161484.1 peptidase S10 [Paraburkholderia sp. CHISQ3]MDQ6498531.1 peptidase S10 [Paraburkholderia megapolitana]